MGFMMTSASGWRGLNIQLSNNNNFSQQILIHKNVSHTLYRMDRHASGGKRRINVPTYFTPRPSSERRGGVAACVRDDREQALWVGDTCTLQSAIYI